MQIQPPGQKFTLNYTMAWHPEIDREALPPAVRKEVDLRIEFCLWTMHACAEGGQPQEDVTISVWRTPKEEGQDEPGYIPVVSHGFPQDQWGIIVYYSDDELANAIYRDAFGNLDHWI